MKERVPSSRSSSSTTPAASPDPQLAKPERCCRFFMVGHTMYKGVYLPSADEYAAHGYPREGYERAMAQWKRGIDETGRP